MNKEVCVILNHWRVTNHAENTKTLNVIQNQVITKNKTDKNGEQTGNYVKC